MGNEKVDQIFCCLCCINKKYFRRELRCVLRKWRVGLDGSIDPVRLCCLSMRGISPESWMMLTARQELFRPRVHEKRRVVMSLYEYLHTRESWTDGILVWKTQPAPLAACALVRATRTGQFSRGAELKQTWVEKLEYLVNIGLFLELKKYNDGVMSSS